MEGLVARREKSQDFKCAAELLWSSEQGSNKIYVFKSNTSCCLKGDQYSRPGNK